MSRANGKGQSRRVAFRGPGAHDSHKALAGSTNHSRPASSFTLGIRESSAPEVTFSHPTRRHSHSCLSARLWGSGVLSSYILYEATITSHEVPRSKRSTSANLDPRRAPRGATEHSRAHNPILNQTKMAEPAPSHHRPLPPPYAAVQPRPRRPAGPNRRGPPNEEWPVYGPEDLSPYPIWSVLIVRGTLTAFGIATLGYVAHLHAMAQSLGLRSDATIAIAGVSGPARLPHLLLGSTCGC